MLNTIHLPIFRNLAKADRWAACLLLTTVYQEIISLERFITFISTDDSPAAFYHINNNLYEPLLAYYPAEAGNRLTEMRNSNLLSLQHFLQENQARKYLPIDENCMTGADTYDDYLKAKMYFASSDSAEIEKTNGPD